MEVSDVGEDHDFLKEFQITRVEHLSPDEVRGSGVSRAFPMGFAGLGQHPGKFEKMSNPDVHKFFIDRLTNR